MKNPTKEKWVKASESIPAEAGTYKIKIADRFPTSRFFDCSSSHKTDWIESNIEWLEVKQ